MGVLDWGVGRADSEQHLGMATLHGGAQHGGWC